ncbi:GNAT family N-acetyltransferase [Streptomyces flavofungini]|uniref:GNAT family N-acetyltransferase n=1 Tax=Streptomyces flavofungini TaxID=68200 RepID=UPI0025B20E85|nr:GNAT family N-acetyltransferase [Streptomyces flavofungini]WJV47387.1 GNAT family N-acetyltransferase [Streptomyces flavofungini]
MKTNSGLDLRHCGHAHATAIRELLLDVHDEVYEGTDDPLAPREAFARFVDSWSGKEDFACVVAYDREQPVGYAYGAPLTPVTTWWKRVVPSLSAEFTAETGARTFALSELMVRAPWRGTGASRLIHDELLRARIENRVTLLVHVDHVKVRALYESWGYEAVGEVVPTFLGAPTLCAMVLAR